MTLTPARRLAALLSLALGGFAIGLTEFVAMGLLPEIAVGLLGAADPDAVARAGWVISAYALGVVVGAPTIAALTARVPRKTLVVGLLALFVVGTAASAVAPTFELALIGRFVGGLPHGAYFGAAGILAATMLGPDNQAKGYASVLLGLTVANVVGVPTITAIGQAAGWRTAYLAVTGVFLLSLLAVLLSVPPIAAAPDGSPRAELRAFRSPQVWLAMVMGTIGFAGFFAVNSYIAPVTTEVTGLGAGAVPWVLVAMGLGMTAGIASGGWAADRDLRRSLLYGFAALTVSVAVFIVIARHPVGLFGGAFLVGLTSLFLGPAMQARLIAVAPGAQLMGAAVNQSATNLANSLGAALGGLVIARGLGYLAPSWVGIGLAATGLLLAATSYAVEARSHGTAGSADLKSDVGRSKARGSANL